MLSGTVKFSRCSISGDFIMTSTHKLKSKYRETCELVPVQQKPQGNSCSIKTADGLDRNVKQLFNNCSLIRHVIICIYLPPFVIYARGKTAIELYCGRDMVLRLFSLQPVVSIYYLTIYYSHTENLNNRVVHSIFSALMYINWMQNILVEFLHH